jgi:hypothetical protein
MVGVGGSSPLGRTKNSNEISAFKALISFQLLLLEKYSQNFGKTWWFLKDITPHF